MTNKFNEEKFSPIFEKIFYGLKDILDHTYKKFIEEKEKEWIEDPREYMQAVLSSVGIFACSVFRHNTFAFMDKSSLNEAIEAFVEAIKNNLVLSSADIENKNTNREVH